MNERKKDADACNKKRLKSFTYKISVRCIHRVKLFIQLKLLLISLSKAKGVNCLMLCSRRKKMCEAPTQLLMLLLHLRFIFDLLTII